MKELSIKEKAKRYDEAIERAREWSETKNGYYMPKELCEEIFPELKESEDERIRKELLEHCINRRDGKQVCVDANDYRRWADWLEKQSEQEHVIVPKFNIGDTIKDKITNEVFTITDRCISLEYYHDISHLYEVTFSEQDDWELVKQKPTDKVKPTFKVGDWITDGYLHNKITDVLEDRYIVETKYIKRSAILFEHESRYHLWTIEDAKDGDVLAYVTDEEDLWIMIYWSLYEPYEGHVHYHALLVNDNFSDKGTCCICINDLKPATKEQRELLSQKMKEEGYEWDAEKKKLNKIEQKLTDKVEPKFHEGEWITDGEKVWKIGYIEDDMYIEHRGPILGGGAMKSIDEHYHLWTIQDAKDGDVLVCESGERTLECLFIFKLIADREVHEYCSYRTIDKHFSLKDSFLGYVDNVYHPATKEQREQLEKAMAEAGYTFDFEKKELKKIEQKPVEWSEKGES